MDFYRRSGIGTGCIGVLAGGFNPPTVAHLALAAAASKHVDQLLCVIPRTFPHKEYFGATLDQRLEMVAALGWTVPHSIAVSDQGLFVDIARESRAEFSPEARLSFLCGRDAAERILGWDYGRAGVVEEMLNEFNLLVASRDGDFEAPAKFRHRIHSLSMPDGHDLVSSTEVRERIRRGEPWEHLAPKEIVERIREIYS